MTSSNPTHARPFVAFRSLDPIVEVLLFGVVASALAYVVQQIAGETASLVAALIFIAAYGVRLRSRWRA